MDLTIIRYVLNEAHYERGTTIFRTTMPSKGAPAWGLPIMILIIVLAAGFDDDDYY